MLTFYKVMHDAKWLKTGNIDLSKPVAVYAKDTSS